MSGKPAARIGDSVVKGKIVTGSATVLIGDAAEGAADRCPTCKPTVGWPVNPVLGVKLLPAETDFALAAPVPFAFTRSYVSSDARDSALGPGWAIPGEGLGLEVSDTATVLIDAQGRRITFGPLAPGEARFSPSESLWIRRGGPVVPQAEALAPWTGRWAFIPEALQHQPEAIFVVRGTEALHFAPQGDAWRLVAEFDAHGYRTEFGWREGRPATVVDSAGRRYVFFYVIVAERARLHGVARVPAVPSPFTPRDARLVAYGVDPHAPETDWLVRYDYDNAARLVAVRDRSGQIVREFAWTGTVMAGHSRPGGIALHYEWDTPGPEGRVLRQTETDGLSRQFAYHTGYTEVTDSLGRTERYHFEGEGADTRWTGHTRADGSQLAFEYDGFGRQIASIDPLGRRTTSRYDGQGRLTARSLPDSSAWHYALDDDTGAAREIRGPEGMTWKIQRDERARPVVVTAPDGTTTAYTYDDIDLPDRPTTITDARGGVRRLEWNRLGQLTTHTDCSGRSHRFDYDDQGQLVAEHNALGELTRFEHDRLGRVIAAYRPDDSRIAYQYDTLGRVTQLTRSAKGDAHPRTDTLVWDRFGRLTAYRDAGGLTQRYRYDEAGRMLALINENEAQTGFAYDALDRLITETGFDRRTQHYTYNAAGELIARTEASLPGAPVTRYEHNAVGRLIARHLPATACAPAITEHFAWRADGQLASFTSPTAEVRFAFDAAGRVLRESQSHTDQTADPWHYACTHRHGLLGQPEAATYGDAPECAWLSYGSGHLHGLRVDGIEIDFERDALHREVSRSVRPEGPALGGTPILRETRAYTALGQLSRSALATPHAEPLIREYAYDAHAHLASIRQRDGAGTRAIAYAYDASGRLIASQHGAQRHDYRFDPAGNRLDVTAPDGTLAAPADDDWARTVARNLSDPEFNLLGNAKDGRRTPNTAHWPDNRVTELAGVSSRFDGAGNLVERTLADGTRLQLGYDGAHRLVALERIAPDGTRTQATYAYDALSRRIAKTVTTGHDTRTTRYGWDGERLVCEATETLTTTLLYEPDSFVPLLRIEQDRVEPEDDEERENAREETALFAQMSTLLAAHGLVVPNPFKPEAPQARVNVFVTDHLGTPLRLVDHNGKTRWAAQPDDWAAVAEENGVRQPIRFQGQWLDEESGLYYNRYRYYDPQQGRYVTQDPIGLMGGSANIYGYAINAPTIAYDPSGLFIPLAILGAAALSASIGAGIDLAMQAGTQALGQLKDNWDNGDPLTNFDSDCIDIDWADVGFSAVVSTVAPGLFSTGKTIYKSSSAIKTLSAQAANTANRASKIASRINSHKSTIGSAVGTQAAWQAVKQTGKCTLGEEKSKCEKK